MKKTSISRHAVAAGGKVLFRPPPRSFISVADPPRRLVALEPRTTTAVTSRSTKHARLGRVAQTLAAAPRSTLR